MFTQNYLNLRLMQFTSSNKSFVAHDGNSYTALYDKNNVWDIGRNLGMAATSTSMPTGTTSSSTDARYGVRFGTGSTPTKKEDFSLEAPILSGISVQKGTVFNMKEADGRYVFMNTFVLTNTSEAELAIWEAGIFAPVNTSSSTSAQYYCVLIDRIVLTEPIVIAPGASKVITYKVTFNQTLNVE